MMGFKIKGVANDTGTEMHIIGKKKTDEQIW